MADTLVVTNTGTARIDAGDVAIFDAASGPYCVVRSSSAGEPGFAGVALTLLEPNGTGTLQTGGLVSVNVTGTPGLGDLLEPGPAGQAQAGTAAPCALVLTEATDGHVLASLLDGATARALLEAAGTAAAAAAAAQATANTAVANAATAQSTANTGVTNAAAAQTTANTAVTNAATAQAAAVEANAHPGPVVGLSPPTGITATPATPGSGSLSIHYLVVARDATGQRSALAVATARMDEQPRLGNAVTVAWSAVAGATDYQVFSTTTVAEFLLPLLLVGTTSGTSLVDSGQRITTTSSYRNATADLDVDGGVFAGDLHAGRLYFGGNAPNLVTVTATNGGGSLTGTYYYAVTLLDSAGHESTPVYTTSGTVTAGSIAIVVAPTIAPWTVRVYRGTVAGTYTQFVEGYTADDDGTLEWVLGSPPTVSRAGVLHTRQDGGVVIDRQLQVGLTNAGVGVGGALYYRIVLPNTSTDGLGKGIAHTWSTWSARRFKQDEAPLTDALALLALLAGRRFRWRDAGTPDVGLIADDVLPVLPEAVDVDREGQPIGLHPMPLIALLIEGVNALAAEVAALKGKR